MIVHVANLYNPIPNLPQKFDKQKPNATVQIKIIKQQSLALIELDSHDHVFRLAPVDVGI